MFNFDRKTHQTNLSVLVTQSCLTLCNSMDCNPPGSSVQRIPQARIVEWAAISFSKIGRLQKVKEDVLVGNLLLSLGITYINCIFLFFVRPPNARASQIEKENIVNISGPVMNACQIDKHKNLKKKSTVGMGLSGAEWGLDLLLHSPAPQRWVPRSDRPRRVVSVGLVLLYLWPHAAAPRQNRVMRGGASWHLPFSSLCSCNGRPAEKWSSTPTWRQVICGYWQTDYKVFVERKKTQDSQSHTEEEGKSWRLTLFDLKTYYKATIIKMAWDWWKNRSVNTIESS